MKGDPQPQLDPRPAGEDRLRVSVIITTFNRAGALAETLERFNHQSLPAEDYEVVVTDDGSTDETPEVLAKTETRYALRTIRFEQNRGISAGRNAAIRESRGDVLVLVSDDVLVPENFLARHLEASERWQNAWIVGSFEPLPGLEEDPFARWLAGLEAEWETVWKVEELEEGVWRMGGPTARNLSIPRAHLEEVGLFDERFRATCEDQDLAERARPMGVQFLWDESIACIHNDQAADLERCAAQYERGAADTVLLCSKYSQMQEKGEIPRVNGPIQRSDGIALIVKKALKRALTRDRPLRALHRLAHTAERMHAPDSVLARIYTLTIGVHMQRGWIKGSSALGQSSAQLPT